MYIQSMENFLEKVDEDRLQIDVDHSRIEEKVKQTRARHTEEAQNSVQLWG